MPPAEPLFCINPYLSRTRTRTKTPNYHLFFIFLPLNPSKISYPISENKTIDTSLASIENF